MEEEEEDKERRRRRKRKRRIVIRPGKRLGKQKKRNVYTLDI